MRILVLLVLTGCIEPHFVDCGDGTACPVGTICSPATLPDGCVSPDQIAECVGLADGAMCDRAGKAGWCDHGACIAIVCGNGRVDLGEACDDGNQISNDGCAGDCGSTERCGNAVVDAARGEQCDDGNLVDHDGCDSQCRIEVPAWAPLQLDKLDTRTGAMVFDTRRRQIVWFGGSRAVGGLANDTWIWNGRGWALSASATAPTPRAGHAMAFDRARGRIVLFGGAEVGGAQVNDTWEWDGVGWNVQPPGQHTPGSRVEAAMAYDERRHVTVMFGGTTGSNMFSVIDADQWEWNGTAWTPVTTPTMPPGRKAAAMAYDPVRGRIVMYGGREGMLGTPLADLWEYDGIDWTLVPSSGPGARVGAAMAWDPSTQRIVMFGGTTAIGGSNHIYGSSNPADDHQDTWAWDGASWTLITSATLPDKESDAALASDDTGVLLFGGSSAPQPARTWHLQANAWSNATPPAPAAQRAQPLAFDARRGRAVMIDSTGVTWESDGGSWGRTPAAPLPGSNALAYDAMRGVTIAFGSTGATRSWDGATWTTLAPASSPGGRTTALAYDAARDRIVMFGGSSGGDETWEWDGTTWSQIMPAHRPEARTNHALAYDPVRARVVLFGGAITSGEAGDTWVWDGSDWSDVTPAISPSSRQGPAVAWNASRERLTLFGGADLGGNGYLRDTWEWDGAAWTFVVLATLPTPRGFAAMFPTARRDSLVLFGGEHVGLSGAVPFDETWLLRWSSSDQNERCTAGVDLDGDGLAACADPDCWYACTPLCSLGVTSCPAAPSCGDGVCDPALESCRLCPIDCGACTPVCGDGICDPNETCVGDCS